MSLPGASDKVPPYNLDAERSVLGACLLEREALFTVTESLISEDFYDPRHRAAFELLSSMAERDMAVDSLTFREEIKRQSLEEKIGGMSFIASLIDAVTTTANIDHHIEIVRDKAIHRGLIAVGSEITRIGFSEEIEVDTALESAEQKVFEIARSGRSSNVRPAKEVVASAIKEIERRLAGGLDITGIPTGFSDFDRISGGLQPGGLYIVAARPAMGKTSFALNIAQYAAIQENIPVLVFSLEMSAEQIADRMIASESRVNVREMFTSQNVGNEQWEELSRAAGRLSSCPLYIDDSPSLTTIDLRGRCRRFFAKQKSDRGLVVLDYLQLMNVQRRSENRQQEVSEISRSLKAAAREFNVPVLALSQLSRDVEKRTSGNKKPQLSDLRDSGAIEQDADMVVFLYREAYYALEESDDPTAEVIVAKHRNGPTGKVDLVFFKEYARFENKISGYN